MLNWSSQLSRQELPQWEKCRLKFSVILYIDIVTLCSLHYNSGQGSSELAAAFEPEMSVSATPTALAHMEV